MPRHLDTLVSPHFEATYAHSFENKSPLDVQKKAHHMVPVHTYNWVPENSLLHAQELQQDAAQDPWEAAMGGKPPQ